MLLCDWAALYSVAEQLVVRQVPRPLPFFCRRGCGHMRLGTYSLMPTESDVQSQTQVPISRVILSLIPRV